MVYITIMCQWTIRFSNLKCIVSSYFTASQLLLHITNFYLLNKGKKSLQFALYNFNSSFLFPLMSRVFHWYGHTFIDICFWRHKLCASLFLFLYFSLFTLFFILCIIVMVMLVLFFRSRIFLFFRLFVSLTRTVSVYQTVLFITMFSPLHTHTHFK